MAERKEAIVAWYQAWQQGTFAVYFDGDLNELIARKCGCDVSDVRAVIYPMQKRARRAVKGA